MVDSEQVRVIDSNRAIEEKMASSSNAAAQERAIPYQPVSFDDPEEMQTDGLDRLFSEGLDADSVDGMFVSQENIIRSQEQQSEAARAQIQEANLQAEEILAQANAKAQEIIEQAHIMSEQDARTAYEHAKTQGMQDGYQQGIQKANAEAEAVRNEYRLKEQELQRAYEEKLEEMEPYLMKELTEIYEHVFAVELSQYRNILQHLIANTLRSVEMSDNYLIHVSEQDYSYVSMQKAQIMEEGCVKNASLEIVEDRTLSKNECLVETEDGIFDCSLSVQLTELKRKLQLLSYTGNKE